MAQGSSNPTSNLTKVANTAVDTSTGNASAGTQRVVLATNQPVIPISDNAGSLTVDAPVATPVFVRLSSGSAAVDTLPVSGPLTSAQTLTAVTTVATLTNQAQMGGQAISMGTGVRDAGTQRVTIATNDVVPASQSGTWTVQPGNTANTTPWLIRGAEFLGTATALGALNAEIVQALNGTLGAAATITAVSTPTGITLTPYTSYDGGTNWTVTQFFNSVNGDAISTLTSFTAGASYSISAGDGATHVKVVATAWTSGSVTIRLSTSNSAGLVNLKSTAVHDDPAGSFVQQLGAFASSTAPTAVSANGDAVRLWATTSGALNIADGGASITVDGPLTNTELRATAVPVSGTIELGATSLAALENISVTVPGTVDLGTVSLTALETITVTQSVPANFQATATQALGSAATRWYTQLSDGTNSPSIKAASTAAVAADPALVVAISPNNSVAVSTVTNLAQLGGAAISMGTGVRGAGVQRVTIATDDIVPASQSGTWTVQPGNTANTTAWLTRTPAVASTATALGALNAAIALDVSSNAGASMVVTAIATPVGIVLTPQLSFDGGTNWVNTQFDNPSTGDKEATIPNASLAVGLSRSVVTAAGTTHVRVIATSWTSGSATVQIRGTQLNDPSVLFAGSNNSTTRPVSTAQVGGWDGTNLRTLTTNASGHLSINDGGNSITVDGTVSLGAGAAAIGTVTLNAETTKVIGTVNLSAAQTLGTVTNLAQLGGTAISMNTGVRDAGTQRVTIATNDSVPVTGTFWQATQPVSGTVSINAIPAGANSIGTVVLNPETTKVIGTVNIAASQTLGTVTNLSQLGGVAIAMNTGVRSTGTQRVTIATDDVVSVSGPLTDAQLRATAVPVSGTVTANAGTGSFTVAQATAANLNATVSIAAAQTLGTVSTVTNLSQLGGAAISMNTGVRDAGTQRVTIATNDVVPVSGTVTSNQGTAAVLANAWPIKVTDGVNTATVKTAITEPQFGVDTAIVVQERDPVRIRPAETYRDSVDKMRVSTPQSMIDTDFEYGVQPTKWEGLALMNNRPTAFYDPTTGISNTAVTLTLPGQISSATYQITNLTAVTATKVVTATLTSTVGITVGTPIFIQGTLDRAAVDGWWIVDTVTGSTITFLVNNTPNGTAQFDPNKTYLYIGSFYSGSAIAIDPSLAIGGTISVDATGTFTTTVANTFTIGQPIVITGTLGGTGTITGYASGNVYYVIATNGTTTFQLSAASGGAAITTTAGTPTGLTYTKSSISVSGTTVIVKTADDHGLRVGNAVYLTGATGGTGGPINGSWIVSATPTNDTFTYTTNATATGTISVSGTIPGTFTSFGAGLFQTTSSSASLRNGQAVTITGTLGGTFTFTGYVTGNTYYIVYTNGSNAFQLSATPNGAPVTTTSGSVSGLTFSLIQAFLYPRQPGYIEQRPFDGGVQFSNETAYHGYQDIRQTRRYFRYQSGKGIQFSTGTILKPPFYVDSLTSSGTTVTVNTKYPHGLLTGSSIVVAGASPAAYNGTFTVTATTPLTITYTAGSAPASSPATGFPISVSPNTWYGGSNRIGMFDQQNGFFFEFDGQQLYAVIRKSVDQLSGNVTVTQNSQTVTGVNTFFSTQLKPLDQIVIRGMSYTVQQILSNTSMIIYPEYRGQSGSNNIVSKTIETRVAQSNWNIDTVNSGTRSATNPNGFLLDLTKMQMFYMDYSWYGAGAVRFGFKDQRGEVIMCHRMVNSNVNTEAYMRSGNMPARYETNTLAVRTYLTATLASATTTGGTITVNDTSLFPPTGTIVLTQSAANGAYTEYITYSAKTATTFTIAARAQTGGVTTAKAFTFSATAPIKVESYSPQAAQTLSHWGSSVIMDGRYDDDKSLVFNTGLTSTINTPFAQTRYPILSLRLAPSVDNGLTGLLGNRELINRMQLTLASMGAFTKNVGYRIEILLNARVTGFATFTPVGGSSLAQVCNHAGNGSAFGGESMYAFYTNSNDTISQDLSQVRDIGSSILGGGTTLNYPDSNLNKYPDGPDIITIVAIPLESTPSISIASIADTAGNFTCSATTGLAKGQRVIINGTFSSGNITGHASGNQYYIINTNGRTTFQLSATEGGTAVASTAGTGAGVSVVNNGVGQIAARINWTEAQA
jgi:hypothetical protein